MFGPLKRMIARCLPRQVLARVHLARMNRELARFTPRVVRHRYGDWTFDVHLADPMSAGWYDHDWPMPAEFSALRGSRLLPGARVFELGAHHGVVALMLSEVVGPEGQVIAVEANPRNADVCRRNVETNGKSHVQVIQAAVAERSGELVFSAGWNGQVDDGQGLWGRVSVPAVTIDDLTGRFGPPDAVYLDVEGYECHALAGAAATLVGKPDCFVEVHLGVGLERFGGSVARLLEFLPPDSYSYFAFREGDGAVLAADTSRLLAFQERFFLVALANSNTRGRCA
jgi:FkbM family methyltransferase